MKKIPLYVLGLLMLVLPFSSAYAASASLDSLSPTGPIKAGTSVTFNVTATGYTGTLVYSLIDSFPNTTAASGNINSSTGIFTWSPSVADAGVHNFSITVSDANSNSFTVYQQIIVTATPTLTISVSPSATVNANQTLNWTVASSGFTNPFYSVSDSFSGTTLAISAVNSSSGSLSWTPQVQDIGVHSVVLSATDSYGASASTTQSITVNSNGTINIVSLSPGATVASGQTVTFSVTSPDLVSPTYTLKDSFNGSSMTNSNINATGNFSWLPGPSDVGVHTITVLGTDGSGHSATKTQQITVTGPNVSIGSLSPGVYVNAGTPVSFSVSAVGYTSPVYTVHDAYGSSISNANITSNGFFAWTPASGDVGVHNIVVTVSDATHNGSANVQIVVSASAGATTTPPPSVTSAGSFTLSLSLGSTGAEVTALQNLLIGQGLLSGTATGYFGALTQAAVMKFQTAHGLSAVGNVGPQTRAALNGGGTTQTTTPTTQPSGSGYVFTLALSIGSSGAEVTALQTRLTAEGVYSGPISGYFGALTSAGVKAYQAKKGIAQLGNVGPLTRAELNGN